MQLTPDKIAAIAVAAVVVFWPQLRQLVERVRATAGGVHPAGGYPRSAIVQTLLTTQEAVRERGATKAADLIGQAVVELIKGDTK